MGASISSLEQAVTSAEIAQAFSGKAIGFKAHKKQRHDNGFFFLVYSALYQTRFGNLKVDNLTFGFEEGEDSLSVRKKVAYKDLEEEIIPLDGFVKYCSPKDLEQHEEITIVYAFQQPKNPTQEADIRFVGAYVPGTDIGMRVRGIDFLGRDFYIPEGKRVRADVEKERLPKKTPSTPHTPDSNSVPLADIIRGYASEWARENKDEYNRHQANVRYHLKQGGVYKGMEKKGKGLFFKREILAEVHGILQKAGFGWCDTDSPYDPSKDEEESPDVSDGSDVIHTETAAKTPIPQATEVPKARATTDSSIDAEINKALARGDVKLGTAVYRIIPAEYDSRGERIKGIAEEWRDGIRDYALNNPLVSGCMYLLDGSEDCYFIRREKMREFYQNVIGGLQNEIQVAVKECGGIIKCQQPDIRFTPSHIEGFYNQMLSMISSNGGHLSKSKIERRLQRDGLESFKGFIYFHMIKKLAEDIWNQTKDLSPIDAVSENGAINILKTHGVKDHEMVFLEREESLRLGEAYSKKELVKIAIETKFREEHPHVFYD